VHGRTNDICKPTQKKYHAAVTIAMGKNMDAIVVEEEATAIACIAYLKDQKCAP
jgi:structural maintenance of chromosome 1